MFTVIIKLFLSDKCNWDWMQSCKQQRTQAIKELKDFASEFDRKLHCAVVSSSTLERDEAFCEVIYESTMPDDLQMKIESVVQLLAQDATQQMEGMRFVLKTVDKEVDFVYSHVKA